MGGPGSLGLFTADCPVLYSGWVMLNRGAVVGGVAALVLAAAAAGAWLQVQPAREAEAATDEELPIPPVPPRIAEGEDYDKCLGMLNADPSGALAFADAWARGGEAAAHCRALAEIALGEPDRGAQDLERLAKTSNAEAAARATIYGQAGQAWIMAGSPARAFAAASLALALNPDDPDLWVDRSVAASGLERYREAAEDLTQALEADPRRVEALVFRAAAWRHLDKLDLAQDDIDRAFAQDPENPDALLERGILRQRRGDPAGARRDWERAMALSPDTATGDLAQQNLALLEAGPERR
ncbi:MAG TPA: tetratricopeptide repeat protein [Crenalkalicoccus sp.]|nr:tetratricopeptide repeat protein [Crenalkalicoccus sp.]